MLARGFVSLAIPMILYARLTLQDQASDNSARGIAAAVFISPRDDIAFALNIPNGSNTDLYFSIRMRAGISWGAIGLGSSRMAGSLMLMIYSSSSTANVTLSPRLASGHSEPIFSSDIKVEPLTGSGLIDNTTYLFNGKCLNCRAWRGGSINITNKAQEFTYGIGPEGGVNSDDFNAPLKYHQAYGSFKIDMTLGTGPGGISEIGNTSFATTLGESKSGKSDVTALMHAIFMVLSVVVLFPLGIIILRLGDSVRWHLINQGVAFGLTFLGIVMGTVASTSYNRSKAFSNPHQIIGLIVFMLFVAQYLLGYMHHRAFKKTQQTTRMAPIHVVLGRVVIVLGIITAFTGFPFALSPKTDAILAVLVVVMLVIFCGSFLASRIIKKRLKVADTAHGNLADHEMEPWHSPGHQIENTSLDARAGHNDAALKDAYYDASQRTPRTALASLAPIQSARSFV